MKVDLRKVEVSASLEFLKNRRFDRENQPSGSESQQINKITDRAGRI